MSTTTKLPPESFVALAAVAWADGRMSKTEAAGLLAAARGLGLGDEAIAQIEGATRDRVDLGAFDGSSLSSWERLLTYGVATWLSRIDGVTQTAELASLKELEDKLRSNEVTNFKLQSAASAAFDVSMLPEGRRPERYDFAALESTLRTRLPTV